VKPWHTLATVPTAEGPLELRRRGDAEYLIVIAGRVLMNSAARRSEEALATVTLTGRGARRVLIGGLGMGFTLRAALDAVAADARVTVVELNADVLAWCKGPLAEATGGAVLDPRVSVELADVGHVIARAPAASWDAILLDLYEGPYDDDAHFGTAAVVRARRALAPGGVLAVWSEEADPRFQKRLVAAGFDVATHRISSGDRRHTVYVGVL
jgi:spermidine synthase